MQADIKFCDLISFHNPYQHLSVNSLKWSALFEGELGYFILVTPLMKRLYIQ